MIYVQKVYLDTLNINSYEVKKQNWVEEESKQWHSLNKDHSLSHS